MTPNPAQSDSVGLVVPWGVVAFLLGLLDGAALATMICLAVLLPGGWAIGVTIWGFAHVALFLMVMVES